MDEETKRKVKELVAITEANFKASVYSDSVLYALRDAVIELLSRVYGLSLEQARAEFESNRKRKHQALLEEMERISPNLAGNADERGPDDVL
jgi:hypothetical protein